MQWLAQHAKHARETKLLEHLSLSKKTKCSDLVEILILKVFGSLLHIWHMAFAFYNH